MAKARPLRRLPDEGAELRRSLLAEMLPVKAPFPWFGGKSRVSDDVWQRFGDVANYVEPFFGSGAVLLGRPTTHTGTTETVNDLDGFVANFWRATSLRGGEVETWLDNPVNENDLHARHLWLLDRKADLADRLNADPTWCDPQIAGWWVWGLCCWIGSGWCSGNGPWVVVDGKMILGNAGQGVKRQQPHLGDAGRGVNRQLPHLGNAGRGVLDAIRERVRNVRVCSGDWSRICGPSVTWKHGITGVFLDPPYTAEASRASDLYAEDSLTVGHDVVKWAIENGDNKLLRIAICGYENEYVFPSTWDCHAWKAYGGFAGQSADVNVNATRERIWFSPHCLSSVQGRLF